MLAAATWWSTATFALPDALVPLHLAAVALLAAAFGWAAHLHRRWLGVPAAGRLRLLAAAQVLAAGSRLLERERGLADQALLAAAHSLLDLTLLVLALYGLRRLHQQRLLGLAALVPATALALVTIFWGLVAGAPGRILTAATLPAAAGHLLFYLVAAGGLLAAALRRLGAARDEMARAADERAGEAAGLRDEVAAAREQVDRRERLEREQREEVVELRQWSRTLEKILIAGVRINSTRSLADLLQQVVEAVQEILGFRKVLLRLYSPSTRAFEARAFAGYSEESKAHLSGIQVTLEEFRRLTGPRFRISNSFLIGHRPGGDGLAAGRVAAPGQADGAWHAEDALLVPLTSPGGETRGYLSLDEPVDGRMPSLALIRQLEILARQATTAVESAEVYDRLAGKNRELARASEMLASLGDLKANLLANVSHELRTPLTSISAYTEMLRSSGPTMSDEMREEFLRVITKESEKLGAVIDDILDLSRMEDGRARVERRQTDLAALLRRLEETWRERAAEKRLDLELALPEGEALLQADPVLLQQMIEHLLGNALKFTPVGGRVRLELELRREELGLSVADTGIGIPVEKMPYIFDHFYQADGSATREHGGQGLGLAICRDIVRHHDGRIWAENLPDGGARFRVLLPRRPRVVHRIERGLPIVAPTAPADLLDRLLTWVSRTVEVDIVSLMVPDEGGEHLVIQAAIGLPESVVQGARLARGAGIAGKVWASGRGLLVPDVTEDARFGKPTSDARYTTASLLSVPLTDELEVLGVLNLNNRRDGWPLDEQDRLLVEALAPRLAQLLRRSREFRVAAAEFAAQQDSLRELVGVRGRRDGPVAAVCRQVCLGTAARMKLPRPEIEHLAFALQCYDVGMSRVPEHILRLPRALTAEERRQVEAHVAAGMEILDALRVPAKVRQIVLHHHERHDGHGYPEGLEGEAIPLGARLLALGDSLAAMLQERPHRPALSLEEACAEVTRLAGSQFCPRLTGPFLAEIEAHRGRLLAACRATSERPAAAAPAAALPAAAPAVVSSPPEAGR